jgi:hypothetical protein
MKYSRLQFDIDQLRKEKMVYGIESISVFIFALFATVFLPQLLYKYFYANQKLLEEPKLLGYIPVAAFVLGVAYFAYAMIGNLLRAAKISKLEKELANTSFCDCAECDGDQELKEMSTLAEKVVKAKAKKKVANKKK